MFKFIEEEKIHFLEKGFVINSSICGLSSFEIFANRFNFDLKEYLIKNKISELGGYRAGNLNINPGVYGKEIFEIIKNKNFEDYFKFLTNDEISDYGIYFGGNLNLPKSKNQFFHTDGNWDPRMIILNFATSNIDNTNGPLELIESTHREKETYLSFLIKNFFKKKTKIFLKKGEILIREHRLWHRGTKNISNDYREMLGVMLIKKTENRIKYPEASKNILIFSNMFGITKKEKIKEFIFINLKLIFFFYKIFISIIKK